MGGAEAGIPGMLGGAEAVTGAICGVGAGGTGYWESGGNDGAEVGICGGNTWGN